MGCVAAGDEYVKLTDGYNALTWKLSQFIASILGRACYVKSVSNPDAQLTA